MKIITIIWLVLLLVSGVDGCRTYDTPGTAAIYSSTPIPQSGVGIPGTPLTPVFAAKVISISPSTGAYLTNSENVSSEVLLKDVQFDRGVSGKQYFSPWYPGHTVSVGDPVWVVSGIIQNMHKENKEIAMYAEGYDNAGQQVAWTLDDAHIAGQIGLHLESGEAGHFTLHLNMAENIASIRIFANNYAVTPP